MDRHLGKMVSGAGRMGRGEEGVVVVFPVVQGVCPPENGGGGTLCHQAVGAMDMVEEVVGGEGGEVATVLRFVKAQCLQNHTRGQVMQKLRRPMKIGRAHV